MPNFIEIGGVTRKPLVDLTRNDPIGEIWYINPLLAVKQKTHFFHLFALLSAMHFPELTIMSMH